MYTWHLAKQLAINTYSPKAKNTQLTYRHAQLAPNEGNIYSHKTKSTLLTILKYTGMYSSHPAKGGFTRTQREAHSLQLKYIPACTVRTLRRKNLLAHSEKHTAYNLKKYTGTSSSHPAKKKITRTQRGAHSSQFEKIYRHVQFAPSEGNIYSHTARSTQLTI